MCLKLIQFVTIFAELFVQFNNGLCNFPDLFALFRLGREPNFCGVPVAIKKPLGLVNILLSREA